MLQKQNKDQVAMNLKLFKLIMNTNIFLNIPGNFWKQEKIVFLCKYLTFRQTGEKLEILSSIKNMWITQKFSILNIEHIV